MLRAICKLWYLCLKGSNTLNEIAEELLIWDQVVIQSDKLDDIPVSDVDVEL